MGAAPNRGPNRHQQAPTCTNMAGCSLADWLGGTFLPPLLKRRWEGVVYKGAFIEKSGPELNPVQIGLAREGRLVRDR